jgi:low affinity Fe/Cu permease
VDLGKHAELQHPVTIADEQIGLNAAIAAAVTRCVGSMPALYVVLVIVAGWMALATWGPLHRVDPYPFAFLLFLNNVVQLVLCSVILVGQRVLGMAADRRAVQTYQDAEAIFVQIADLQEHLDRHDRVLSRGVSGRHVGAPGLGGLDHRAGPRGRGDPAGPGPPAAFLSEAPALRRATLRRRRPGGADHTASRHGRWPRRTRHTGYRGGRCRRPGRAR